MKRTNASLKQPAPSEGEAVVVDQVVKDLNERAEHGLKIYGTKLKTNNGRDALWDAYQESLDLCLYLRQRIMEEEIKKEK